MRPLLQKHLFSRDHFPLSHEKYVTVMTHGGKVKSAVPSWFVMMFLHSCSIFSDTSSEGSKPGGIDKGFVVEGKD